jgi:hypothetical protein
MRATTCSADPVGALYGTLGPLNARCSFTLLLYIHARYDGSPTPILPRWREGLFRVEQVFVSDAIMPNFKIGNPNNC